MFGCNPVHAIKVVVFDWNKMFLFSRKSRGGQWTIKLNMNYEGNEELSQARVDWQNIQ